MNFPLNPVQSLFILRESWWVSLVGFSSRLDFLAHAQPEEQFMGQFTGHRWDVNIPVGLNLR